MISILVIFVIELVLNTWCSVVTAAASAGRAAGGRAATVSGAKGQLLDGGSDVFQTTSARPGGL